MDDNWDGKKERRIHDCLKESEWGRLEGTLNNIVQCQLRIENRQTSIMKELFGNGKAGLHTEMAIATASIARVWWWLSAISIAILGVSVGVPWYVTRLVVNHIITP